MGRRRRRTGESDWVRYKKVDVLIVSIKAAGDGDEEKKTFRR